MLTDDPTDGALEDLCIRIIKNDYKPEAVIGKIDTAIEELEQENLREFRHRFKSRLHGFFSLTDEFVGDKIGEASDRGAFDWGSGEFDMFDRCIIEGFGM